MKSENSKNLNKFISTYFRFHKHKHSMQTKYTEYNVENAYLVALTVLISTLFAEKPYEREI